MSDLDIRIANAADAPTIAEIYRPHVVSGTATFELTPPDAGEIAARIKRVTGEGYPYFVAASGGQIAGYAYAASFRARPAFRWTVEDSIYIASTHQGRGLGKRLLQALIKASTAANFRQMVAVIGDYRGRGIDRPPPRLRLQRDWTHAVGRLQARRMAGSRYDAACAGSW